VSGTVAAGATRRLAGEGAAKLLETPAVRVHARFRRAAPASPDADSRRKHGGRGRPQRRGDQVRRAPPAARWSGTARGADGRSVRWLREAGTTRSKLRAKLGLKPLEVGTTDSAAKAAEDNYAAHKEEMRKKAEQEALREKLAKYGTVS